MSEQESDSIDAGTPAPMHRSQDSAGRDTDRLADIMAAQGMPERELDDDYEE